MTVYGESPVSVVEIMQAYDERHAISPQRGELLRGGAKSNNYDYSNALVTLAIRDGVSYLVRFAWGEAPEGTVLDGHYVATDPTAMPTGLTEWSKGDLHPNGSGLVYAGDREMGGNPPAFSDEWHRPDLSGEDA